MRIETGRLSLNEKGFAEAAQKDSQLRANLRHAIHRVEGLLPYLFSRLKGDGCLTSSVGLVNVIDPDMHQSISGLSPDRLTATHRVVLLLRKQWRLVNHPTLKGRHSCC